MPGQQARVLFMGDPPSASRSIFAPIRRFLPGVGLRHTGASLDSAWRGLLLLMGVRWALDLLFLLNVLPLSLRDGWYLHHGGDQELMLSLARSLLAGVPEESVVGLGQALVMVPWVALLHPYNYVEMVAPLVVLNGFLFGGLSVLLVGGLAHAVSHDGRAAWLSAAVWAVFPLLTYFAFFWHTESVMLRSVNVPKLAWLNGLSDGPATFFLLAALLLLARQHAARGAGFWSLAGVGAALGLAVTFRIHTAPIAAFLFLHVLLAHGWQALLAVSGAALLVYLPQAWYNLTVFGIPFTSGYVSYGALALWGRISNRPLEDWLTSLPYRPANALDLLVYLLDRRPWLWPVLALGLAVGVCMALAMWRRRGWRVASLLVLAPLVYLAPMVMAYNFRADMIRFLMPVVPVAIVALVDFLLGVEERLGAARSAPGVDGGAGVQPGGHLE